MSKIKTYNSPGAFRAAFRRKIPQRLQKIRIMQRFAARVCMITNAVVKGGLALELRFAESRTTKDIDLAISGSPDKTLSQLNEAAKIDLGDFLEFDVEKEQRGGEINTPGMAYVGARFVVQARFGARETPEARFSIDVTYGSQKDWDEIEAKLPEFPNIQAGKLRLYPIPKQISEKLHAYTDPRIRDDPKQVRVRDLADICFFASRHNHKARDLRQAIDQTFTERQENAERSHKIGLQSPPDNLPSPPQSWQAPYAELARRDGLPWEDVAAAYEVAKAFIDPILIRPEDIESWEFERMEWTVPGANSTV